MFHTISNIDNTINLEQYINNRNGNKRIGLKFIRYSIGWYNVYHGFITKTGEEQQRIMNGYYSFQQIVDEFQKENIVLSVNEANGIASLNTTTELKISKGLGNMLGFNNKRKFEPNELHYGNKFVDFAIHKSLYIHLEQVSTSHNYLDGKPSTLLAVIPVENKEFGEVITARFEHPEYKCLVNDVITELKLEIRDENNNKIINHLPINCVLEVI
ncbi:unnamed protein product [Mytilus edulis]|uniref:Uncharacterized protein n=1 Tax=Mytilus edulis TaxID=6550 RepID=A0A8S3RM46_MYTED|nr:unnamed protein product [Mytilus edulis]